MTEFITRHGELLTIVSVTDDPVYQDEPYVQSTTYQIETTATIGDGDVQRVVVCGEWRHRSASRSAFPPRAERGRARRVAEGPELDSGRRLPSAA